MTTVARVPASCGELMQGALDGRDFLINAPIDLYAEVAVGIAEKSHVASSGHYPKIDAILRGFPSSHAVTLRREIPRGKGMASSTAELAAVIAAIVGADVNEKDITDRLMPVDHSTDHLYSEGITMVNHLTGKVWQRFGTPPPLAFILVDTGGNVDTHSFDRTRARAVAAEYADVLREGLALLDRGFRERNATWIARAATISARVNQHVLFKDPFTILWEGTTAHGALGVNCAHTGTVLGVMFDPTTTDGDVLQERVVTLMGASAILGTHRLVSGGVSLEAESHGPF